MEQKWPSHLVIVRHGESGRNVSKEIAKSKGEHLFGSDIRDIDVRLTNRGHLEARITGEHLAKKYEGDNFDVIFTSPYRRTVQTARQIRAQMKAKIPLVREERIREIEFGILDGLTTEGIKWKYPEEFSRRKRVGKYWYRPPGGESRPDVALRVHSFLGALTRDYREKRVLVVCHSVVVLIFRRLLERWGERKYMKTEAEDDVRNCSVTIYEYNEEKKKLILKSFNKYKHLSVRRSP
jgi:2,3-bisphosphoglycerate-dependent phosphoglycerate mutase